MNINKYYNMKKIIASAVRSSLLGLGLAVFLCPADVSAFEHAYERTTDNIYMVARNGMTVYEEPSGEVKDFIPDFEGVVGIGQDGSWYEVRYKKKKKTRYGYVTKDEFEGSGLEYDGRDKQVIADGKYRMEMYADRMESADRSNALFEDVMSNSFLQNMSGTYEFTYVGNHAYHIMNNSDNLYLGISAPDEETQMTDPAKAKDEAEIRWVDKEHAGDFVLVRRDNVYRIVEQSTKKYLALDDQAGLVLKKSASDQFTAWRLLRTRKAIKDNALRCFCQYDPQWAHYHYGKGKKKKVENGNYSTSGCGALATFNAIYSVTGQLPDVFEIGRFAAEEGYRIEDFGTDSGFFSAAANHFGYKFGFAYDGSNDSFESLKKKLGSGDTAIVYLPGHYGTIVSYSPSKDKYLLLDPHKLPKRGTSEWGNWVSREDLSSGDLYAQAFFYYRRIDDLDKK